MDAKINIQLQELRKKSGMKQKEMAERLGVDVRTYGAWERRENTLSLEQAFNCAVILECTIDEIAGREHAGPEVNFTDPYQAELNACYEASTAEGRSVILGTARGQRELSKKVPEGRVPEADRPMSKAM